MCIYDLQFVYNFNIFFYSSSSTYSGFPVSVSRLILILITTETTIAQATKYSNFSHYKNNNLQIQNVYNDTVIYPTFILSHYVRVYMYVQIVDCIIRNISLCKE
jgi:hypothetical protein